MSTTDTTATGKKGDIRIAFGFMRVEGFELPEPCLHLYTLSNKQVLIQIPAVMMFEFDERDRDLSGEPKCMPKCKKIAEMLYGMPTSYGGTRVLDAISEWLTDIKNLPPPPTYRNPEGMLDYMRQHGFETADDGQNMLEIAR